MHHFCGGFSGIQRWSASNTGDNGGLGRSLTWILSLAMCGHSNTTCDMNVHHIESIHFGLLLPWAHLNNWEGFNQPWWAGDGLEAAFTFYARLRYRMIPYIYSCAVEAHETGMPRRPLGRRLDR